MVVILSANTSWYMYNFRAGLIRALVERGHRVVTIAPKDSYSQNLVDLGSEHQDIRIRNRSINPIEDLWTLIQYWRLGRLCRPTYWLNFTIKPVIYGAVAAHLVNAKTISTITGLGTSFLRRQGLSWIVEILYQQSQKTVSKVFFQNEDDRSFFVAQKKLINPNIADYVPGSGIDLAAFPIADSPNNKNFTFLMIGRLLWDKGISEYISAAVKLRRKNKNWIFLLAGRFESTSKEAVPKEYLEQWIQRGIIDYVGESDDIKREIRRSDCVVLPSYREGLPRALLEAAALGKPAIAADVPGSRSVIRDGVTGFLCHPRSATSLERSMERMAALPSKDRVEMGNAGRKLVEAEFQEKYVIEKYLNAMGEMVNR